MKEKRQREGEVRDRARKKTRAAEGHSADPPWQGAAAEDEGLDQAADFSFMVRLDGLPRSCTKAVLLAHYKNLGYSAIRKLRWIPKARGSVIIVFSDPELAATALKMPGPTFGSSKASVVPVNSSNSGSSTPEPMKPPSWPQMFLGNCPDDITEQHIYEHYRTLGPNAILKVIWVKLDGAFRGYGFVHFKDEHVLNLALKMPAPKVCGRLLDVRPGGRSLSSDHQLFVGQLTGTDKTVEDVAAFYRKRLGPDCITRVRHFREKDGSDKGCGFIDCASRDVLERILALPAPLIKGKPVRVMKASKPAAKSKPGSAPGPGPAAPPAPEPPTGSSLTRRPQLIIRHCPPSVQEEDLLAHYAPLGPRAVTKVHFIESRRVAFVTFKREKLLRMAMELGPPVVDFHVLEVGIASETKPGPRKSSSKRDAAEA